MIIDNNDESLWLYISESEQHVLGLDRLLRGAEKAGELTAGDTAEAFRLIHSLKGASAMMQYGLLEKYSHDLEDVFSALRASGGVVFTEKNRALTDACFMYSDYFLEQLERLKTGKEINANSQLEKSIGALGGGAAKSAESAPAKAAVPIPEGSTHMRVALSNCPMPHVRLRAALRTIIGMCASLVTDPVEPQKHPEMGEIFMSEGLDVYVLPKDGAALEELVKKLAAQPFVRSVEIIEDKKAVKSETTLRVTQTRLNSLLALLDEITTTQSMLAGELENGGQTDRLISKLRRDTAEAREMTAEMGMTEIGAAFGQMRRLVRSMAREYGRSVSVNTTGDDVRVDGSAMDAISDALIHIVRNAVDHGIEPADKRASSGKSETGAITLSAFKAGGAIRISVSDDGGGIDRAAVLEKAARLGLIDRSAKNCTDAELFGILSAPGFSTNTAVTRYSGRGVGLDAAVRRIRDLRGEMSLSSEVGKGTTFTISIPTSLALRDVLCAEIDGREVALPVSAIGAVVRASFADAGGNCVYGGRTYKRLITGGAAYDGDGDAYILLTPELGDYCLRAKRTGTPMEALIKPIPVCAADALKGNNIYSGCFIDNNGGILCVLDVYGLIKRNARC